ncbi:hypothetical protein SmJEL517_g05955 [Synchytrium microbalum]|uniref:Iron-sulfur assembly protein 1 n=1 Tax=Synchytrium microbalum TaxID=1806994 RepID=A0A507BL62_9FUNG|nr:uncharacterized protein SmJEL517_g05955 [Synchytrium microbalum]TPX30497.1 hypothetical protein SmJEL517_g05955 [Synchytrium microbalum]
MFATRSLLRTAARQCTCSSTRLLPSRIPKNIQPIPIRTIASAVHVSPVVLPNLNGPLATVRKTSGKKLPRKAALTLTESAVSRLKELVSDPLDPKLLKVGTKKKGCSGQTYNLEYVSTPSKFDEVIEQDGVKVLIDSKALFSLVGSEMDYIEDKLSSQFVFHNPNVKEMCGCGQSFMT